MITRASKRKNMMMKMSSNGTLMTTHKNKCTKTHATNHKITAISWRKHMKTKIVMSVVSERLQKDPEKVASQFFLI